MIVQIKITNAKPTPVVFRGTGFFIYIPGFVQGMDAQIPYVDSNANIRAIQFEHPYITVQVIGAAEGYPTNDLLYISPDYLLDKNYQGVWDASAGADPHEAPEEGWFWRIIVGGSHPLDGIFDWDANDHVKWNGTRWMRVITWPNTGFHKELNEVLGGGDNGEQYHLTEAEHALIAAQQQTLSPNSDVAFKSLTVEDFDLDGGVLEDDPVGEGSGHTIKLKRGQADGVDAHVPAAGEPVFDLERKELRVGDGVKTGGHIIGRAVALDTQIADAGITVVDEIPDTEAKGALWFYIIDHDNSSDMRTGKIQACWNRLSDGAVVPMPEESGPDLGSTLGVVHFIVEKTGHTAQLKCLSASDGWAVDIVRMPIG